MKIKNCRICNTPLTQILSFGKMPIVNYYLSKEELKNREKKYSLTFCICQNCTLGQLDELVSPDKIFVIYHYASSVSKPLKTHLEKLADICIKRFTLSTSSHVLDIGCNDGVLLSQLQQQGIQTVGIDPAKNIVSKLKESGIPAIADFFSLGLAKKVSKKDTFDVIVSTNTLAQVIEIQDFISGIKTLLKEKGIFVGEVGYLIDMLKKKTFDSIYHEHYSYFSLQSLLYLFTQQGLTIFDAQKISNHGGSLRIFAVHKENKKRNLSKRMEKILDDEKKFHLEKKESYRPFITYFTNCKKSFKEKLVDIKKKNNVIAGVTSPAKGVILLNYCHIDNQIIDFIVDSTPHKQYRYMPGVHIPIFPEDELDKRHADYLLILAWTYKEELLKKLEKYRKKGAKIILPLPSYTVLS